MPVSKKRKKEGKPVQRKALPLEKEGAAEHPEDSRPAHPEMKAGKPREEIVKSTAVLKGFPDHGPLIPRVLTAACDELGVK